MTERIKTGVIAKDVHDYGKLAYVSADLLEVNLIEKGQRPLNTFQLKRLINNFDAAKMDTLTVVKRNEKHYIVDGQHRFEAGKAIGVTRFPCRILEGLTDQQTIDLFIAACTERKSLTAMEKFWLLYARGDKEQVDIFKIAEEEGYKIGKGIASKTALKPYVLHQIGGITAIYRRFAVGPDVLRKTLSVIRQGWSGEPDGITFRPLAAIAQFIYDYRDQYEEKRLISVLNSFSPQMFTKEILNRMSVNGGPKMEFANGSDIIFQQYNKKHYRKKLQYAAKGKVEKAEA